MDYLEIKVSKASVTCTQDLIEPLDICSTLCVDLNAHPDNLDEALVRLLLLNPTPSEIYALLPPKIVYSLLSLDPASYTIIPSCLPTHSPALTGSELAELDAKYPPNRGRPGGKLHADPSTVYRGCRSADSRVVLIARWLLNRDNSDTLWESTLASALIALPALSRACRDFFVDYFFCLDIHSLPVKQWTKMCKVIHTAIRVTRCLPTMSRQLTVDEARQLYGVDLLSGPSEDHSMSAKDEIQQRMGPSAYNAVPTNNCALPIDEAQYSAYFTAALQEVVREDLPPTVQWPTFKDWYADRLGWAASGGAPGFKVHWDDSTERLNKRGALLSLPYEHVETMLRNNDQPLHYSKAATKFEKGKKRAIWNTSIYHYLFQAYVLDCLDAHLRDKDSTPDGPRPANWDSSTHKSAQRLATQFSRLSDLASGGAGLMWDFSDFNINHSMVTMVELFRSLGLELMKRTSSVEGSDYLAQVRQDFLDCCDWISRARVNTILDSADQTDPLVSEIVRSLQSGERATSFTNTFENRIYLKVGDYTAQALLGRQLLRNARSQQGDDVFVIANSVYDGVLACGLLNISGAAGQVYKITLDYDGRGEFLRYAYDAKARTVIGYPVRSALGLISGEFFMEPIVDPDARAVAYLEAFNRANLRGANLPSTFLDALIARNCSVSFTTSTGRKTRITGDVDFALCPAILGGLGATGYPPMRHSTGSLKRYQSSLARPTFKPPTFDTSAAFKKFSYADQQAAHRLGLSQEISRTIHDIAARSSFTGAYKSAKLSDSIAKYAQQLALFKKSLTLQSLKTPPVRLNLSRLREIILLNWLRALGLTNSSLIEPNSNLANTSSSLTLPLKAFLMPSGSGKTRLARRFPELFIDHDDYVTTATIQPFLDSGDTEAADRLRRTAPIPRDGRILLTWTLDTLPPAFIAICAPLVSGFTGPRLFREHRDTLLSSAAKYIIYFESFEERELYLVTNAHRIKDQFLAAVQHPAWGMSSRFTDALPPRHLYGSSALYTRAAGFSLQEALNAAVARIAPLPPHDGLYGRWLRIFKSISPNRLPGDHQQILSFLTDGIKDQSSPLRLAYFSGSISWLPPIIQNHSPDVLTVARDITLAILEEYCTTLFTTTELDLVYNVHVLEREVTYLFEDVITPLALNSSNFSG